MQVDHAFVILMFATSFTIACERDDLHRTTGTLQLALTPMRNWTPLPNGPFRLLAPTQTTGSVDLRRQLVGA